VYAAGGLGGSSSVGIEIESFVPESEIFLVAEALKRVFEAEGDRVNRRKARLRFVLARLGKDAFIQCYQTHKQAVSSQGFRGDVPELRSVLPVLSPLDGPKDAIQTALEIQAESTPGYYTVRLQLPLGDVSADDLCQVADMSRQVGVGFLRVTQGQDLLLLSVPHTQLSRVEQAVDALCVTLQIGLPAIAACAGAATCKLGLCRSRGLAGAVAQVLADRGDAEPGPLQTVRISGCPNGCAQHLLADLGFQGRARRVGDRLMPYYDVFAGSRLEQGCSRLAQRIGSLPAKRVPGFVKAVYEQGLSTIEALQACAAQHAVLDEGQIPEDYFVDFDACRPFSLKGLGPGECSAGVMDIVNADIKQAQDAMSHTDSDSPDPLSQAALAAARALLVLFGTEAHTPPAIVQGFKTHLVDPGWVDPQTHEIVQQAGAGSLRCDAQSRDAVQALLNRIVALHGSLDGQLNFTLSPVGAPAKVSAVTAPKVVDLRGVACPLSFVKAKLALERVEVGAQVEFLIDLGEAQKNVHESLKQQGHQVITINPLEDHVSLIVKRQN
jgi:sulfite reductase (ferredoxin)